ncbi:polysaccharide lyase family 7 protein, partial [Bacteroides thetaiotaomicron]|nr:polysaccharide lyase family 7 protein [Bacteroides thetaiotaomicron]
TANGTTKTFTMDSSFDGESFYFKAGDYDQTAVSGTPLTTPGTVVKFYALTLTHS